MQQIFVKNSKWQTRISFNGGHSKTEKIAQEFAQKSNGTNTSFTPQSYDSLISEYERKIETGSIKSGDQIVLMISSHGGQNTANETTHIISTSSNVKQGLADYGTLSGSGAPPVSLDRLKNLTKLANSKGINLGILDFSCHSGITQKLANENTCVISSTGPNHFAWAGSPRTFSAQFTQNMSPGKSIEDVFLAALKGKRETSFPMISGDIGEYLGEEIYPYITPYLYDTDKQESAKKLKDFYLKRYDLNKCENLDDQFKDLIEVIENIEDLASKPNLSVLKKLLTEYQAVQNSIIKNLELMNSKVDLTTTEKFCDTKATEDSCWEYSLIEILNIDFKQAIAFYQNKSSTTTEEMKENASILEMLRKAWQRQNQLLKEDTIKAATNFWNRSEDLTKTYPLALEIAAETSKAFHAAYLDLRESHMKSKDLFNPCAKIKF